MKMEYAGTKENVGNICIIRSYIQFEKILISSIYLLSNDIPVSIDPFCPFHVICSEAEAITCLITTSSMNKNKNPTKSDSPQDPEVQKSKTKVNETFRPY